MILAYVALALDTPTPSPTRGSNGVVRAWIPPDVGAMLAISANDSVTVNMPQHTIKVVHMAPAVPPLDKEKTVVINVYSQVRPSTIT